MATSYHSTIRTLRAGAFSLWTIYLCCPVFGYANTCPMVQTYAARPGFHSKYLNVIRANMQQRSLINGCHMAILFITRYTHTHTIQSYEFVRLHTFARCWKNGVELKFQYCFLFVVHFNISFTTTITKKIVRIKFCSSAQRKIINNPTICRQKLVILLNILLNVCDSRFGSVHSTIFCFVVVVQLNARS